MQQSSVLKERNVDKNVDKAVYSTQVLCVEQRLHGETNVEEVEE
jgi:hypothetical protein